MLANPLKYLVRPERFELPTYWFVASCSIQLSHGRTARKIDSRMMEKRQAFFLRKRWFFAQIREIVFLRSCHL